MTFCYSCGALSTSREHVPPKCLFPEAKDSLDGIDRRINLITVPACTEHNLTKSGDDEYFLYVLSTSITSNEIALAQVQTKLGRAIARRPALTTSLLEGSKDCWVRDSATGAVHEATQFALDGERFSKSLELVAKGIYFHHFGERWEGKLHVRADFIDFPHEPNAADIQEARMALASYADELFKVEPKHGSNPDVFWYQVHTPCEGPRCLLRMGFFGGSRAIAFFGELRTRG